MKEEQQQQQQQQQQQHSINHLFTHLHVPKNLAIEFIATFSRLEYALKAAGYATRSGNTATAHWDAFANKIDDEFKKIAATETIKAKNLLLNHPPKKQALSEEDGALVFREHCVDHHQKETQQVLLFVRTVRNNLFHGGKYLPDGEQEKGRNENLVSASLQVLKACIELDGNVKDRYEK